MKSVPLSSQNNVELTASLPFSQHSPKHSFITARLDQIGVYHEQLASLVGEVQATQLVIELAEQKQEDSSPC